MQKRKRGFGAEFIKDLIASPPAEECIIWPLARTTNGYGRTSVKGRALDVHRLVCRLAHGEPPSPKHHAAHSCGRGKSGCVNPAHLRWASPQENKADQRIHGTMPQGGRHGNAIMTDEEARRLFRLKGTTTAAAMARQIGVDKQRIWKLWTRQSYAEATRDLPG